jgi:hypothetical protein
VIRVDQIEHIRALAVALGVSNDFATVSGEVARRAHLNDTDERYAAETVITYATATDAAWAWACGISPLPADTDSDLRSVLQSAHLHAQRPATLLELVAGVLRAALNSPTTLSRVG